MGRGVFGDWFKSELCEEEWEKNQRTAEWYHESNGDELIADEAEQRYVVYHPIFFSSFIFI